MKYFETVVASDDTERHKPHPEPLHLALERMHGSAERAVMIGDTEKDIVAASNAGCDSILFYPPEHQQIHDLDELRAHNPTYVVSNFRDIIDIVN